MVIDHGVDVGRTDPPVRVRATLARAVRGLSRMRRALLAADESVPATVGNVPELGDVDVVIEPG